MTVESRQEKNQIFNQEITGNNSSNGISQNDDIPTEIVPLPSLGKVYPKNSPLHLLDKIEIRSMTAREEDLMTSPALAKKGTTLSEVMKACIIDKRVNVREMLTGDRNAILVSLRIISYGSTYDVELSCPKCEVKQEHAVDLTNVPINPLSLEPDLFGENLFSMTLPLAKKRIQIKFLTGGDEEDIIISMERKKQKGFSVSDTVTTRLQYAIASIEGNPDKLEISKLIRNMRAGDSLAIRRFISKNEPSIELVTHFECKSCNHIEEVDIPLDAGFFWPRE